MTKQAPKTKGLGWDVFSAKGSGDNTDNLPDYCEIQRIDCPGDINERYEAPAFDSDLDAVRHVVALAKRGDPQAIKALWSAYADPLVHRVLWEDL